MAPDFSSKDIQDRSLGQILRECREKRGDSLESLERETNITKKYLIALEGDDFKRLPDLVYAKNFVRALAKRYGLDAEELVRRMIHELSAISGRPAPAGRPATYVSGRRIVVTPQLFKASLGALFFLGILGYFGFSVHRILTPPPIDIWSPKDNQVFSTQRVTLQGKTEPESELTVNQESVPLEADGSFTDTLDLPPGVSLLRVAAKKKHSRENEIFLKVVVQEAKKDVVAKN